MCKLFRCCCAIGFAVVGLAGYPYNTASSAIALDTSNIEQLIYERALVHETEAVRLLCVLRRESRLNPNYVGSHGEIGIAQWLPGRGNAWEYTNAYRVSGINIFREYSLGNPDAVYFDIDAAAEMFSRGHATRRKHWFSTLRLCE